MTFLEWSIYEHAGAEGSANGLDADFRRVTETVR